VGSDLTDLRCHRRFARLSGGTVLSLASSYAHHTGKSLLSSELLLYGKSENLRYSIAERAARECATHSTFGIVRAKPLLALVH